MDNMSQFVSYQITNTSNCGVARLSEPSGNNLVDIQVVRNVIGNIYG